MNRYGVMAGGGCDMRSAMMICETNETWNGNDVK